MSTQEPDSGGFSLKVYDLVAVDKCIVPGMKSFLSSELHI